MPWDHFTHLTLLSEVLWSHGGYFCCSCSFQDTCCGYLQHCVIASRFWKSLISHIMSVHLHKNVMLPRAGDQQQYELPCDEEDSQSLQ